MGSTNKTKNITMDWDTFQAELKSALEEGVMQGQWEALSFLEGRYSEFILSKTSFREDLIKLKESRGETYLSKEAA